jgi:hypothetical protein
LFFILITEKNGLPNQHSPLHASSDLVDTSTHQSKVASRPQFPELFHKIAHSMVRTNAKVLERTGVHLVAVVFSGDFELHSNIGNFSCVVFLRFRTLS